ncbi:MAG: cytochrome ubiquinol oxidase subunit I [Pseudomonadota bacterium]
MDTAALNLHRFHFAFTATYHYLFPQFTMGLALLIVVLKTLGLRAGGDLYNRSARFWGRIFGISFVMGVVTGIPMEFQFGTNWATFSRDAGGVIGQTLAMEGVFAFFLEPSFLSLFLFGEKKLGPRGHWWAAFLVFLGAWLSGYFIIAANAWMQHPVGYRLDEHGKILLESVWALLLNPWAFWQYLHNMSGAVITGSFAMAAVGAFYLLSERSAEYGKVFVRIGVIAGLVSSCLQLFPTGDRQAVMLARYQPVTIAAIEGLFVTKKGAPITLVGQPDVVNQRLDNPLYIPKMLSFLVHRDWNAEVKGLDAYPKDQWPDQIPLLYYSYHAMIGLGMLFIAILLAAAWQLMRRRLYSSRKMLWVLMLGFPLPFVANTAGWMTAELGRQPWLIYGLYRTAGGSSQAVSGGNVLLTLIGFMGMYALLSVLFLFLTGREISIGPEGGATHAD